MKKKNSPLEADEQKAVFRWIRSNQIKFQKLQLAYSTLNGVRLTPKLRKEMKEQGNRAGVPDIVLPARNKFYPGLYLELKRVRGGSVSKEQKKYMSLLAEEGFKTIVCKGHKEAIEVIKDYLRDVNEDYKRILA